MKREKLFSCLIAAALAFGISFGGVACIVTGFSMDAASLPAIMLFCAVFSLAAAACFSFRHGWWVLAGSSALILGYLWRADILEKAVEALLYRISVVYNGGYGLGIVRWTGGDPMQVSVNPALCLIAAVTSALAVWTVCRRRRAAAAVTVGFLPLIVCLVVIDTVPDSWCLFVLLAGQVPLILTNTVRRRSALDGNKLTALLLVPSLLATSLLFWAVPREGYTVRTNTVPQSILSWFQGLPFMQTEIDGPFDGISGNVGSLNLTTVGPKVQLTYPVMEVKASRGGPFYLRGQSLDAYNGRSWDASESSSGYDGGWPMVGLTQTGTVTVDTRSFESILYFPYYPGGENWKNDFDDGTLGNSGMLRRYTFDLMEALGAVDVGLEEEQRRQCLQLPSETRSKAEAYLASLPVDVKTATTSQIVEAVGDYVRNSAEYDLDTGRMPGNQTDFAMWFLEQSNTGYCVHFASAAVVLLRAADIPARYASGYLFNAVAGKQVTVTSDKAHAWVEYFDPVLGWRILDPTPASDDMVPQPSVETQPVWPDSNIEPTVETTAPTSPDVTWPSGPDATVGTVPGGDDRPVDEKPDVPWLWMLLRGMLWIIAALAVVVGQYLLRLRLRRKRMHTGSVNARALAGWQEVVRLHRILKTEPPEELYRLAEKAKFSQHVLTAGERMAFDRHLDRLSGELAQMNWIRRTLIRLIWAVE